MSDSCVTNKASFSEVLKLRCSFYHFLLLLLKQENYSYSVSPTNPFYSTAKSDIRETDGFFETPPEFLMLVFVNTVLLQSQLGAHEDLSLQHTLNTYLDIEIICLCSFTSSHICVCSCLDCSKPLYQIFQH